MITALRAVYRLLVLRPLRLQVYGWRQDIQQRRRELREYTRRFGWLRGVRNFTAMTYGRRPLVALAVPGYAGPLYLRRNGTDHWIFRDVIWDAEYAVHALPTVRPQVIVDAGAHAGYASTYFAATYPEARIIAVEPDAANRALFARNTAPYADRITLLPGALWPRAAWLTVENPGASCDALQMREGERGPGAVPAVTPEELVRRSPTGNIDILKIDIEGAERTVFSAETGWLERVSGTIVIEIHERFAPGSLRAVAAAVARHGFVERSQGEYLVTVYSRAALLPGDRPPSAPPGAGRVSAGLT